MTRNRRGHWSWPRRSARIRRCRRRPRSWPKINCQGSNGNGSRCCSGRAPLPAGSSGAARAGVCRCGGQVVFFPPRAGSDTELFGIGWRELGSKLPEEIPVENWARRSRPFGSHQQRARCLVGKTADQEVPRAKRRIHHNRRAFARANRCLVRGTTTRGGAYFLTTTPAPADSSLAADGIALYVLVQRALATGAAVLGNTRQLVAGERPAGDPATLATG